MAYRREGGGVSTWKRPSTPADPARAVLESLAGSSPTRVVHGSTVATNALLERRGPRTVLVTSEGFTDLLEIRRQVRPQLYALEPSRPPHVVIRGDAIAVRERLDGAGRPVLPLTVAEVERVVSAAKASGGEAFAVTLLFSFLDPSHEERIVSALRSAGLDASASCEVAREHREYERASTTAINTFLRPVVRQYLDALAGALPGLRVMHSAGGLTSPEAAGSTPVTMVLSGPAGGVLGAVAVGRDAGFERVISFDMGGTSTDVSLADGEVRYRAGTEIDGLAVNVPMVDVVTIGAGGGSLAHLDSGGALVVGPESAGADPGPACYGRGVRPAVSDADLVLGRLRAEQPLAGNLRVHAQRARTALAPLGHTAEVAAAAVAAVVDANMARAVRRVSLERGFDPAAFTLVAFGGAGPLHACEVAATVGVRRVLVPRFPGVLSALGMTTAPDAIELSQGLLERLDGAGGRLPEVARGLERQAQEAFAAAVPGERGALTWYADARYAGQAHELRVSVRIPSPEIVTAAFHGAHERQFGFSAPGRPVEVVALRARVEGRARPLPPAPTPLSDAAPPATVTCWSASAGGEVKATMFEREGLVPGQQFHGPAVVVQDDATTFVPAGWSALVDGSANLVLEARG